MATNNSINLNSSGIVKYDGAGSFSAVANPLTVANGGSGVSSTTAYAVLCGGTTSTGNLQSIASVGTSGQVLTSNGAGALPTFQATPTAQDNLVFCLRTLQANPADGGSYFLANGMTTIAIGASGNAVTRFYCATSSTITACYGVAYVDGLLGSSGNSTIGIRLNNTTTTNVTTTLLMSSVSNSFSNTGLSISVVAGDYIEFTLDTPTWTSNPTAVTISLTALLT